MFQRTFGIVHQYELGQDGDTTISRCLVYIPNYCVDGAYHEGSSGKYYDQSNLKVALCQAVNAGKVRAISQAPTGHVSTNRFARNTLAERTRTLRHTSWEMIVHECTYMGMRTCVHDFTVGPTLEIYWLPVIGNAVEGLDKQGLFERNRELTKSSKPSSTA